MVDVNKDLANNGIIGHSPALKEVFRILYKVAPTESTVLVTGESGTGKELIVRALHDRSHRHNKPFVPINCGAIPKELLESELFGHEKGAFTHAVRSRAGRFELAKGGTVFLDEIGEMDLSLQVKILRVLQEKEFERVGGSHPCQADVRIVAATNRDLEEAVSQGVFREDLYYRLNVIPLHLPPLRERAADILLLADYFLKRFCDQKGRDQLKITPGAQERLKAYSWPGNVRELENFMERISILCEAQEIDIEDLPLKVLNEVGDLESIQKQINTTQGFVWPDLKDLKDKGYNLKDFLEHIENRLLHEALEVSEGVKNQAAEVLGIKRTTLIEKLKKKNFS